MSKQQFHRGDLVRTHREMWADGGFGWGCDAVRHEAGWAVIIASYRQQYGGGSDMNHSYTILWLDKKGQPLYRMSWWEDHQVDFLVEAHCQACLDILEAYENEEKDEDV
jgi:hypothetical protein